MKKTILFGLLFLSMFSKAQEKKFNDQLTQIPSTVPELSKTYDNYIEDSKLLPKSIINKYDAFKQKATAQLTAVDNTQLEKIELLPYNPKMLNMFIANNVSTYLTSSKDLSLQDYYAVLESADGSLFIGYNFNGRENKTDRLKNIFNIGFKSQIENNFSNLLTDGKLSPELGLNLKYTYVFRGSIQFEKEHQNTINNYRTNYIKNKYKDDLAKFSDKIANSDENTELEAKIKYINPTEKEKKELIQKEYFKLYEKIATDEEAFITENKLFNSIDAYWFTVESYIPFTEKEYQISPSTSIFNTDTHNFYNFNSYVGFTGMRKWSSKRTLYGTISTSLFNNNTILTKELKKYVFETITTQSAENQTVTDTKDAYVGNYSKVYSQGVKGEIVYFFFKDIIGISIAGERVFGKLGSDNWKFAVPFSLKDKDDKPSINFELQWKEINKAHFVGISVGYAFGKFLK
jgi:hypothetical protein